MKKTTFKMSVRGLDNVIFLQSEKGYLTELMGIPVIVHSAGYNFVFDKKIWRVSEPTTGMSVVQGDFYTRQAALDAAEKIFQRFGADAVKRLITEQSEKLVEMKGEL